MDYLIHYNHKGHCWFEVDGEYTEVLEGELLWVPPGKRHSIGGDLEESIVYFIHFDMSYHPDRSHWCLHIPAGFKVTRDYQKYLHPPLTSSFFSSLLGRLDLKNSNKAINLIQDITYSYHTSFSAIYLSGLLLQLLGTIETDTMLASRHDVNMRSAAEDIREQVGGYLSLSSIAKQMEMSEGHFRRCFKDYHKCTPREYFMLCQMEQAVDELLHSTKSITEIAEGLGYENPFNFTRSFKKFFGVPPSHYRKATVSLKKP